MSNYRNWTGNAPEVNNRIPDASSPAEMPDGLDWQAIFKWKAIARIWNNLVSGFWKHY